MPVKSFRPKTPSQRYKTVSTFEEITKDRPEKSLLHPIHKKGGKKPCELKAKKGQKISIPIRVDKVR